MAKPVPQHILDAARLAFREDFHEYPGRDVLPDDQLAAILPTARFAAEIPRLMHDAMTASDNPAAREFAARHPRAEQFAVPDLSERFEPLAAFVAEYIAPYAARLPDGEVEKHDLPGEHLFKATAIIRDVQAVWCQIMEKPKCPYQPLAIIRALREAAYFALMLGENVERHDNPVIMRLAIAILEARTKKKLDSPGLPAVMSALGIEPAVNTFDSGFDLTDGVKACVTITFELALAPGNSALAAAAHAACMGGLILDGLRASGFTADHCRDVMVPNEVVGHVALMPDNDTGEMTPDDIKVVWKFK